MTAFTAPAFTTALANHLWQSTVLVVAAWLLTHALRNNQARTRYNIWLIASLKFLVPFSLLIEIGKSIASKFAAPIAAPALSNAMEQITQPFPQAQYFSNAAPAAIVHHVAILLIVLAALWLVGALPLAAIWFRQWLQLRAAVRSASPAPFQIGIPVRFSSSLLEPGVFGIFQPVLMLPAGITEKLTPAQLNAIFEHELCHVRRRDNLTFAFHTLVQTLFWFHPLVWCIRKQLIEERENACDESVLQTGSEAEVYAESILNVCKFYIESPLACVSGVTGSDLKKRIVRIMTEHAILQLNFGKKLLLAAAALVAISVPVTFGLLHTSQLHAQTQAAQSTPNPASAAAQQPQAATLPTFDIISVKPNNSGSTAGNIHRQPDGIHMDNLPLNILIRFAYGLNFDQMINLPNWTNDARYDVDARVAPEDVAKFKALTQPQEMQMLQQILTDRFKLTVHHQDQQMPVYNLVIGKNGIKSAAVKPPDTTKPGGSMSTGDDHISMHNQPLTQLAAALTRLTHRTVLDKTGLTGNYDLELKFTPDTRDPAMAQDDATRAGTEAPTLFTAIQEQLGLKLESGKGPVDCIVIDHIEKPTVN